MKRQTTRSRPQNKQTARRLLADRLEEAEEAPEGRKILEAEFNHKKGSKTQKARYKYRRLETEQDDH